MTARPAVDPPPVEPPSLRDAARQLRAIADHLTAHWPEPAPRMPEPVLAYPDGLTRCPGCLMHFLARRTSHRFCSDTCRVRIARMIRLSRQGQAGMRRRAHGPRTRLTGPGSEPSAEPQPRPVAAGRRRRQDSPPAAE